MLRVSLVISSILATFAVNSLRASDPLELNETFNSSTVVRVEQETELSGRLTLKRDGKSESITLTGRGTLSYDERVLTSDDPETQSVIRQYRTFNVRRSMGGQNQSADLRPDVRRLVVIRSARGKSPFSPDGPLLWNEIDAVRTDPFLPAFIPALLPKKPVSVNATWSVGTEAVTELTDLEKVESGGLTMKLLGIVTLNGRQQARLSLSGSVRGVDDNGPCRHTLDGTAYFDLKDNRLVYLSLKGTHELLDGSGRTTGTIEGRFRITRSTAPESEMISDKALEKISTKPTAENSALLYDNSELGLKFLYSRRWRVGAVQGRQLTLDGPNNAGILITVESAKSLPTAADYLTESQRVLQKTATDVVLLQKPKRIATSPALDRFILSAKSRDERIQMDYAVLTNSDGTGATVAARLPADDTTALTPDLDQILKTISSVKK